MTDEEKWILAMELKISSWEDIKAFAKDILLKYGYDINILNTKEEGIKIESFKKLVTALYMVGYEDGMLQRSSIKGYKKKIEREGKEMTKHKFMSKLISEKSVYDRE